MTRVRHSDYMEWAKTRSQSRFNLATSGVLDLPLAELPVRLEDLELTGPSYYGWPPLQERLAARLGVDPDRVVAANGTSMANYLALDTLLEPGDEVLIEHPTYDLLVAAAGHVGAVVTRFARRAEDGFRLDPLAVERALTPRTRLVVVTNLHNPSSAYADEDTLREVGERARRVGARVLVDEVYREALFHDAPPSAVHLGPEFVVTSSLTKAYGLGGLRCGWFVADVDTARRAWRLNDLFGNIPPHVAERLGEIALRNLPAIADRARDLLGLNRPLLSRFLDARPDLLPVRPTHGTVVFPKLSRGSVENLVRIFREKYEGTVVPGHFFGLPDHFRIGIGGRTDVLAEGLERLGAALDEVGS